MQGQRSTHIELGAVKGKEKRGQGRRARGREGGREGGREEGGVKVVKQD
jgi:hypothetical protein